MSSHVNTNLDDLKKKIQKARKASSKVMFYKIEKHPLLAWNKKCNAKGNRSYQNTFRPQCVPLCVLPLLNIFSLKNIFSSEILCVTMLNIDLMPLLM